MSYKTIYHGSENNLKKPTFHYERSNKHNDYGLGFYHNVKETPQQFFKSMDTSKGGDEFDKK